MELTGVLEYNLSCGIKSTMGSPKELGMTGRKSMRYEHKCDKRLIGSHVGCLAKKNGRTLASDGREVYEKFHRPFQKKIVIES